MIDDCKKELFGFQEGLFNSKKIIEKLMMDLIEKEILHCNDIINNYSALF